LPTIEQKFINRFIIWQIAPYVNQAFGSFALRTNVNGVGVFKKVTEGQSTLPRLHLVVDSFDVSMASI